MIKIWDKKENICSVSAEDYIKNNPAWVTDGDVILDIDDNTGIIKQILNVNVLRSNLNLDISLTSLEVGKAYLNYLENPIADPIIDEEKVSTAEALIDLDTRLSVIENK